MNHPAHRRVLPRQLGKQPRYRSAIGHVTGHHLHLGAGLRQVGGQFGRSLRAIAPPTGQHQMTHPIGANQVAGQHPTNRPGGTGDHHRAVGKPVGQRRGHG
ncbi:Uncharacterised protein [Mycobacterium tuberculosis]|nr:Uncharacterised protein [Mycobacterium tuberculosis]